MVKYSATLRVSGSFRPVLVPLPFPSCPLSFPVSCFVFGCTGLLTNEPHGGIFQAGIGAPLTLAEICLPARLLQIRCAGQLRAGRSAGRVRASASLVRGGLSRQPVHVLCMSAWLPTTSIASHAVLRYSAPQLPNSCLPWLTPPAFGLRPAMPQADRHCQPGGECCAMLCCATVCGINAVDPAQQVQWPNWPHNKNFSQQAYWHLNSPPLPIPH